ncbi:hypothetical protein [Rhizobacter sp. Root1221]|uniref:hypothetical protein n=1 Tax=Rhizobacter sp. Root1221 TaxID=1736433 RepID=UPI0006F8BFC1|nr:hypothetical protein [Rhizobacter sp. Root1221]KQV83015.1 hypothetical protein ASC87_08705 [Rhizobacter sp. Root1221]
MRRVNASMTDSAVARPEDLPLAQLRLVQSPLPLVPAARAWSLQSLAGHLLVSQSANAAQAAAALPAMALDGTAATQGAAMTHAIAKQWMSLHALWVDGLAELAQEMGQFRHANTLSKYVDQEVNLVQQSLALVSNQATATVRLLENIQVNVAWWLSKR